MRSALLSSSLRARKVSFQRTGNSNLDVIHELEERESDKSDQTFPQAVHSSSSAPSSDYDIRSFDLPLFQSSATSGFETSDDGAWKDPDSSLPGDWEATVEAQFAQDLHGRLLKLSRESKIALLCAQECRSSIPPSSRTQSSNTRSSTSSLPPGDLTDQLEYKRSKSDNFQSLLRCGRSFPVNKQCDSLARKRRHPSVSYEVHSPCLTYSRKSKKRRLHLNATVADANGYAARTASFRRALSLRSQLDTTDKNQSPTIPAPFLRNAETSDPRSTVELSSPPGWIPTVPCSPEPEDSAHPAHSTPLKLARLYRDPLCDHDSPSVLKKGQKLYQTSKKRSRALSCRVPIIAPPPDHAYSTPLSEASQAQLRLVRFREREQKMREADQAMRQEPVDVLAPVPSLTLEAELTSMISDNQGHVEDVEMHVEGGYEIDQLEKENRQVSHCTIFKKSSGPHYGTRIRMIRWILEVLPFQSISSKATSHSTSSSSSRSNSSSQTSSSGDYHLSFSSMNSSLTSSKSASISRRLTDLTEQLLSSPETRFHAAYLFRRFFHLVFGAAQESGVKEKESNHSETVLETFSRKFAWDLEGSELVTWDVAVGCLALSVKMHRDFLPPLYPIFSSDYEELAPHDMGYGDLEAAQRDIFSALSYNLGSTPQAILDDLWIALPSLRELLNSDEGWGLVLQETWLILFETVSEPEVMDFSLSLLTAAAVIEGLVSALVRHYQIRDPWFEHFRRRRLLVVNKQKAEARSSTSDIETADNTSTMQHVRVTYSGDDIALRKAKERVRRAKIESKGVILDIQAALGIADAQLEACRKWIAPFVGDRW
ncbi:hypothetical protein F5890DRAFT_554228 [Lentinula detonsa]|uniref:Uncharacterized protein n=1 Tax=Lentinula detonsa TaxID=2804962 RepID=A0AA38Q5Z5_9AGAR|nr:hypothetical protein F5890DRAFT_554228 [Lentinula detonsa]